MTAAPMNNAAMNNAAMNNAAMNNARRSRSLRLCLLACGLLTLIGCASSHSPLPTVARVDLDRFMGDWYVIGLIPNRVEKDAANSVESYAMRPDGKIAITYTFLDGGLQGSEKALEMVARVVDDESQAEWRVRPFWPLSLKYLVTDLADDYRYTVIGHPSRNYVWIMARTSVLSDTDWQGIVTRLEQQGFDLSRIERVPHAPQDS